VIGGKMSKLAVLIPPNEPEEDLLAGPLMRGTSLMGTDLTKVGPSLS